VSTTAPKVMTDAEAHAIVAALAKIPDSQIFQEKQLRYGHEGRYDTIPTKSVCVLCEYPIPGHHHTDCVIERARACQR